MMRNTLFLLFFVRNIPSGWAFLAKEACVGFRPKKAQLALSSSTLSSDRRDKICRDETEEAVLSDLNRRLHILEASAPESLSSFFEPGLLSFSVQPGSTSRISITSTCFSLQAILATGTDSYREIITMDTKIRKLDEGDPRTPVRNILAALLTSDSSLRPDDLFQVPVLLYTLLVVDKERQLLGSWSMDEFTTSRIRQLVDAVLETRPRRRDGIERQYSDYIMFQCCRVYALLYEDFYMDEKPIGKDNVSVGSGTNTAERLEDDTGKKRNLARFIEQALPDGAEAQLSLALQRCVEISSNELYRQLALRLAGDDNDFDIMRLVYSLLTYLVSTKSLAGRIAGRELVQGQGPSKGTKVAPLNPRLVTAALKAFFEEQLNNGLWDKGQPIYRSFRRTGRNVGNAFIFALDPLASLLQELPAESFAPYLLQIQKTVEWIESHQQVEILPDYCDVETGRCYGKALRGWSSPHLSPEMGPQAWSTAQTVSCISSLKITVENLQHASILDEFKGISFAVDGPSPVSWDRLLDSDLGIMEGDRNLSLKEILNKRMIQPRIASDGPPSSSLVAPSYSAILFGPPGTAKTTICEALARRIGWDFVVIDTSVFLADGLANVASRIRYVFERLSKLRRCVILFDEIEEFCLNREAQGIGMESRMLTTAMLTAINDLRRAKRCIFFMATNRLRALDAAITRPGRFDMQLFVGTPNLEARSIQFLDRLADVPANPDEKREALTAYNSFLQRVWNVDAKYMNYLEGVQFATACASVVAQGYPLTDETMASIINSQAAVMTVRGQVRSEFDASITLSRL